MITYAAPWLSTELFAMQAQILARRFAFPGRPLTLKVYGSQRAAYHTIFARDYAACMEALSRDSDCRRVVILFNRVEISVYEALRVSAPLPALP